MKPKEKSHNDVMDQLTRMQLVYGGNHHMKTAYKIAEYYCNNITEQFRLEGVDVIKTNICHEKRSHAVRSYMPDSSREFIASLQPKKIEGLYAFDDNGNKIVPTRIYFGIDTRLFRPEDGVACGRAYYFYGCALRPVFLPNGKRFRMKNWSNICCRYKNGILSDFYRE